jgi:c-di-GMP-binding flagellar brake protein YcgR
LQADAQVVRHAIPDREGITGMGLKFVNLAPEHKARLDQYLRGQVGDEGT